MISEQAVRIREMIRSMASGAFQGKAIEEQREFYESLTAPLGLLADTQVEKINAGGIPAEWVSAPGAKSQRVLLYFHGGGYCIGSCNTHRDLAARLSQVTGARSLLLDYRLAPEYPFPAALEDATAAFHWLLKEGIAAERIVIGGDSAGGGLALATMLALRDTGEQLPSAGVIISGWMDLTCSGTSHSICADLDIIIQKSVLSRWREFYIGNVDPPPILASPLQADLRELPPMIIHVGTDEVLHDDSVQLYQKAQVAGIKTKFEIWEGMWHEFHTAAAMGVPESQTALDHIGEFVRENI